MSTFLQRVREINSDTSYAFFVEEVRLFGSYYWGHGMVGDIDLDISLMRKTKAKCAVRLMEIFDASSKLLSLEEMQQAAMREVLSHLQSRCKWLHITALDDTQVKLFPNVVIYEIPSRSDIVRAIDDTETTEDVTHLHALLRGGDSPGKTTIVSACDADR
jgi:hypothetical protein